MITVFLLGRIELAGKRREADIAQVAAAGAAEMGVAEAQDRLVGIMVARAAVPRFQAGIGTDLDHAEGDRGAGVDVAVGVGADHRQCGLERRGFSGNGGQATCQQEDREGKAFHGEVSWWGEDCRSLVYASNCRIANA